MTIDNFKAPRFPKKELKNWVKEKGEWNHEEWNQLLWGLREQGFAIYTDSQIGQEMIGRFIEQEKQKVQ